MEAAMAIAQGAAANAGHADRLFSDTSGPYRDHFYNLHSDTGLLMHHSDRPNQTI